MAEFSEQIPFFYENFLSKPAGALPKGGQWVLTFEGAFVQEGDEAPYRSVLPVPAILLGTRYEPIKWDVEQAINATLVNEFQSVKGCMFAQGVQIPGESNQVNPEGIQMNGFIRTTVGGGRDAFQTLQISFLETNVSFVENVIRPWTIATAHLGLIARGGLENYRCNLSVYKLGVTAPNEPPYIACQYTFYGVCPISVSSEEYNYTQTGSNINREATFIYHYYTLNSSKNTATQNIKYSVPFSTNRKGRNISRG